MATGISDPERRDRIIDAALALIAEAGVAGVSHRKVAARAGVPLGSMTYHFTSMHELLFAAFTRFSTSVSLRFEARMADATDFHSAQEAVADLICFDVVASQHELVLTHELYTLAARELNYRALTREWMQRSRRALERHFSADTARQLDAMIEGLSIHRALDTEPTNRAFVLASVQRLSTQTKL